MALTSQDTFRLPYFTQEQIEHINLSRIPKHIAIIPDGNRRWARKQELSSGEGHNQGADILMDVVKSGKELGVKVMTFYTFSTENWSRSPEEVEALMWLLQTYLTDQAQEMIDCGIRFNCIGDISKLPSYLIETIQKTKALTADCDKIEMVLALNYGGRDEICRAVKAILKEGKQEEDITPSLISKHLDTAPWGDPDLLVRTSGEMRISNFLLWQLSYTEIVVTDVLWPDFQPRHLYEAIYTFQQRDRRLGGP